MVSCSQVRAPDKRSIDDNWGIIFLISHWNHMLWPFIWIVWSMQFRWEVTTYVFLQSWQKLSLIITKYSLLYIVLLVAIGAVGVRGLPYLRLSIWKRSHTSPFTLFNLPWFVYCWIKWEFFLPLAGPVEIQILNFLHHSLAPPTN